MPQVNVKRKENKVVKVKSYPVPACMQKVVNNVNVFFFHSVAKTACIKFPKIEIFTRQINLDIWTVQKRVFSYSYGVL